MRTRIEALYNDKTLVMVLEKMWFLNMFFGNTPYKN